MAYDRKVREPSLFSKCPVKEEPVESEAHFRRQPGCNFCRLVRRQFDPWPYTTWHYPGDVYRASLLTRNYRWPWFCKQY